MYAGHQFSMRAGNSDLLYIKNNIKFFYLKNNKIQKLLMIIKFLQSLFNFWTVFIN